RLLVTFHGGYKPTGLRRTWPNVIAHEGVMGAEYDKWSARVTPEHNVTLPFTRMLAGPMDYTPGGFRNAAQGQFFADFDEPMVQGTRAHEIAKYVVFESPMPMVADHPAALRGQPGLDFVVAVPTTWDETRGLAGEVGRFVAVGRRSGHDWYVGAMTDWTARTVDVPLAFLGPGRWRATLWADGPEAATRATDLARSESVLTAADTLHLRLAPGGGAAVRLVPEGR
ncbi:MAG TPA: glycoside hydrolase family 97 catalytic domain-containing protein, partial [Vicinamibacteria bacterium]|nr:glycoside hydrolase family 97 catalytic domain-containing protein [Vicinamibacteria bacterium]